MSHAEDWSRAGWQAHLPGDRDRGALVEQFGAQTIPALAAESASRQPDRVAVTLDGERVTHGALDTGAAQVSAWLAGRLDPGDRVTDGRGSRPAFRAASTWVDRREPSAAAVLANPAFHRRRAGTWRDQIPGATTAFASPGPARLLAGLADPPLIVPAEDLPTGPGGRSGAGIRARPQDTAVLAYTSGQSTGRPERAS